MERESVPLSVIIPVLNEAAVLGDLAVSLKFAGPVAETIIVDGGSTDGTWDTLQRRHNGDQYRTFSSPPGRARQMNLGAASATQPVLLFLHADTQLPRNFVRSLAPVLSGERNWGRFDVRFDDPSMLLRMVSGLMNLRSRLTGIATGDQAIFVSAELFGSVGCFSEIPIMEDIDLSRRLNKIGPPLCIADPVTTSARRWRQNGIVRTIFLMWGLRLAFWLGVRPDRLARWYHHARA
jgi:rSAM/selenodomain-associated transferase 2